MRIEHFETLNPICPRCKIERQISSPLILAKIVKQQDNNSTIIEGYLQCSHKQCCSEYPIIDGIPIVINQIGKYLNDNFYHITVRDDLTSLSESILGDAAGPAAAFNSMRHFLSAYGWDHYGDKAPGGEFDTKSQDAKPGNVTNCLNAGINLLEDAPKSPALDIGCAVGRSTFELAARTNGLSLGIDVNFSLLRVAQQVLREGQLQFPLKRTGIVYDRHTYQVSFEQTKHVDFWACDATALPFSNESFNFISALNVLDNVQSPRSLLVSISNVLKPGESVVLTSPYDWSGPIPVNNWLGGHAQRAESNGSSETVVRKLLSSAHNGIDLTMTGEIEHHPWMVRVHSRRTACYDTHIIACIKNKS